MIKNVSSTFKANCKNDSVKYREYIVIDNKELYHCGASLKDLGKKCFAISKMEDIEYIEQVVEKCYQK